MIVREGYKEHHDLVVSLWRWRVCKFETCFTFLRVKMKWYSGGTEQLVLFL